MKSTGKGNMHGMSHPLGSNRPKHPMGETVMKHPLRPSSGGSKPPAFQPAAPPAMPQAPMQDEAEPAGC